MEQAASASDATA
jgi:membrane protein involved in colicin uptake